MSVNTLPQTHGG